MGRNMVELVITTQLITVINIQLSVDTSKRALAEFTAALFDSCDRQRVC